MKAITFGQSYSPSVKTRFSPAALGCSDHPQTDSVKFGATRRDEFEARKLAKKSFGDW
ncbi:MAG: hypothetical protein QE263_08690 [Vampirovibrionales bacterium]|nr:hypothetical protein [Vampirovibrionales bacterium]